MRAPLSSLLPAALASRFAARPVAVAAALAALSALAQAQVQPPAGAASAAQGTSAETDAKAKAKDAADQTLERVEVSGTRASLQRSLNLKRNAAGVQDSISATELGRFPDDNVADSLSHITGGGIIGNTSRVLTDGLELSIDWSAWERPAIFTLIQEAKQVAEEEMRRAFNLGIGLILLVAPDAADAVTSALAALGEEPVRIGRVVRTSH